MANGNRSDHMTCAEALDVIAAAFQQRHSRQFQIALVGYRLDGRPIRPMVSP